MKCYVVDAFADHLFEGNPAAVCVLDTWLSDELMQLIAVENNLSETAFAVKNAGSYGLRWFTPGGEIDLCGHATLATAYVLMRFYEPNAGEISFQTKSGGLNVKRSGDRFEMDFPAYVLSSVPVTEAMTAALGVRPLEAWMGRDLVCVLADERQVCDAAPNPELLLGRDGLLTHITARGSQYDCVSRTFAPKLNVAEDRQRLFHLLRLPQARSGYFTEASLKPECGKLSLKCEPTALKCCVLMNGRQPACRLDPNNNNHLLLQREHPC